MAITTSPVISVYNEAIDGAMMIRASVGRFVWRRSLTRRYGTANHVRRKMKYLLNQERKVRFADCCGGSTGGHC